LGNASAAWRPLAAAAVATTATHARNAATAAASAHAAASPDPAAVARAASARAAAAWARARPRRSRAASASSWEEGEPSGEGFARARCRRVRDELRQGCGEHACDGEQSIHRPENAGGRPAGPPEWLRRRRDRPLRRRLATEAHVRDYVGLHVFYVCFLTFIFIYFFPKTPHR
jgi:hypothetical protein